MRKDVRFQIVCLKKSRDASFRREHSGNVHDVSVIPTHRIRLFARRKWVWRSKTLRRKWGQELWWILRTRSRQTWRAWRQNQHGPTLDLARILRYPTPVRSFACRYFWAIPPVDDSRRFVARGLEYVYRRSNDFLQWNSTNFVLSQLLRQKLRTQ